MYGLGTGADDQQRGSIWRYGTVSGIHLPVGGKYDLEFVGLQ